MSSGRRPAKDKQDEERLCCGECMPSQRVDTVDHETEEADGLKDVHDLIENRSASAIEDGVRQGGVPLHMPAGQFKVAHADAGGIPPLG